ncbi:MAG: hypothetical protein ACFB4I_17445 [Cyanophyceae cyanobacterium]
MSKRILLVSALTILAGVPLPARANEPRAEVPATTSDHSQPIDSANVSTLFNHVFFTNTGNFYDAITIGSQLNTLLGFESFPETQIAEDAELLNALLRTALTQQGRSGPLLRTADLDNPFDTSLHSEPAYRATELDPSFEEPILRSPQ